MHANIKAGCCGVPSTVAGATCSVPPRCPYVQTCPDRLHRARPTSRRLCVAATAQGQAEKFWSVQDVLQEVLMVPCLPSLPAKFMPETHLALVMLQAEEMGGSDLIFEDDSFEPVWEHEQRVASQPMNFEGAFLVSSMVHYQKARAEDIPFPPAVQP